MKIIIYGINYAPELTGIGKYSGEMAEWLACQGHDVQVITAPPYYPSWKVDKKFKNRYKSTDLNGVRVHRCPLYVPKKLSTFKRIMHLATFSMSSSFKLVTLYRFKPDVIINVVPTLFTSLPTILFARAVNAKSILHIQDLEVDAMFGLGMANGKGAAIAYKLESWLLRKFDIVSTISQSMIKKTILKGVEKNKTLFFPNWSEVQRFSNINTKVCFRNEWGLIKQDKVVLYSGNIGEKQGLDLIIDASIAFINKPEVKFVIVGQGAGLQKLQDLVAAKALHNVIFKPLVPYEHLPSLLAMADCHLVVQRKGVADAVLPSKLTNILACGGNAVITAENTTELGLLCEQYPNIAVCVEPECVESLVIGIQQCLDMPKQNKIAQEYAATNLDKNTVLLQFESALLNYLSNIKSHRNEFSSLL